MQVWTKLFAKSGFSDGEIKREYRIIEQMEGVENGIDALDTKLVEKVFKRADSLSWGEGFYILNSARAPATSRTGEGVDAERIRLLTNK